jgi:hypothetical protein
MTRLLKALDLRVIDWDDAVRATKSGSLYTEQVVRAGMSMAYA